MEQLGRDASVHQTIGSLTLPAIHEAARLSGCDPWELLLEILAVVQGGRHGATEELVGVQFEG